MSLNVTWPGLEFDACLVSKVVKAHNFMPDLKVDRLMPVVIDHTTLKVLLTKYEITEANVSTYLSSLTIST